MLFSLHYLKSALHKAATMSADKSDHTVHDVCLKMPLSCFIDITMKHSNFMPAILYYTVLTSELLLAGVELVLLGVLLERLEVGEHAHKVGEVDDLGAGGKLPVLRGVGRVHAARVGGGGAVPV